MTVDQARRRQWLTRWHRRLALIVALWLSFLAASGILVNHAHDWGLDRRPLPEFLAGGIYGVEARDKALCDAAELAGVACADVFARLVWPETTLLVGISSLYLLEPGGQLIEKLPAGSLGLQGFEAVVKVDDSVLLSDGRSILKAGPDLLNTELFGGDEAGRLEQSPWIKASQHGKAPSWERLVLDLHAARFLGPLAQPFTDLMAVLILLLAVSGVWLYRNKRNGNGNGQ